MVIESPPISKVLEVLDQTVYDFRYILENSDASKSNGNLFKVNKDLLDTLA